MKRNPCKKEGCSYPRFGGGYCKLHQSLRTDKKIKTKIKPVGDKRRERLVIYRKMREELLKETPECLNCKSKEALEVHHLAGRENDLLIDKSNMIVLCHKCHQYFTEHSAEAIELGFSKSRITRKK